VTPRRRLGDNREQYRGENIVAAVSECHFCSTQRQILTIDKQEQKWTRLLMFWDFGRTFRMVIVAKLSFQYYICTIIGNTVHVYLIRFARSTQHSQLSRKSAFKYQTEK
jgi:hypothetical protein